MWYGVDWNGPLGENEVDHVLVQDVINPLTANDYLQLKATMEESNCNGIDLYIKTLQFIYQKNQSY